MDWKDSPGEGNSYPLQYSGLENSMDCVVHGVTKSQIRLSNFHSFMESRKMVLIISLQGSYADADIENRLFNKDF